MEEEKHFNKNKLFIVIAIALALIVFICVAIFWFNGSSLQSTNSKKSHLVMVYSKNNSVSIQFSDTLSLYDSPKEDSELLINLCSDENLYVTSSKFPKVLDKNLKELLNADKYSYINNYPNSFNVSEIYPIQINNYNCFAYNFYYKEDLNGSYIDYFVTTVWIEKDSNIYILDIKLPANLVESKLDKLNDLIYSYTIY